MYLNKVILIGNLTRDPELRALPSGTKVCSLGVATNRVWKDKNGQRQEDTQFHNVAVFGIQAENVAQYLRKGSSLLVEGRLQTRSWDAPDGKKQYRTEIIADRVQFGPKSFNPVTATGPTAPVPSTPPAKENMPTIEYPEEEINPEDIPF